MSSKPMHKPTKMPTADADAVGMSSEGLGGVDQLMQSHVDAGDIQGGVTIIARRGKVVHFSTHGEMDEEKGRAMEPDAIFIMASSAKPVICVAALMLVEEGLISLSDPVSKYIPEFADAKVAVFERDGPDYRLEPIKTPVTIHHLLTHTSGLSFDGPGGFLQPNDGDTLTMYAKKIAEAPLNFQPGDQWGYGNTGIHGVMGGIIELVSGTPFIDFMHERVFTPLEMNDSYLDIPDDKYSQRVIIKGLDFAQKKKGMGLCSAAEDFLHFNQMLLNGGELFGRRLLSPETVNLMSSNQVGDLFANAGEGEKSQKGMGFGYAVAITLDPETAGNHRGKGSFGWGGAGGTVSWVDPEHELVAVRMMQQECGGDFSEAVERALIK